MTSRAEDHALVGCWRIIEADLWERDYLDLCGQAMLTIDGDGRGEIAFGVLHAELDLDYTPTLAVFSWQGFDEVDEVHGTGIAALLDDGSLRIELIFRSGGEAVLRARKVRAASASGL